MQYHSFGLLNKTTQYQIITNGYVGVKELKRLISKLTIDLHMLLEFENKDLMPDLVWYCPAYLLES